MRFRGAIEASHPPLVFQLLIGLTSIISAETYNVAGITMVDQTLADKVAILSGSAGGEIGKAIAKELADKGAYVVINYP